MSTNTVVTGTYAANEIAVYNYLTGKMGLNNAAACGIMANIWQESGFNQTIPGDNGAAYGLIQWNGSRKSSLIAYCNKNGVDYRTVEGQMMYLEYELNNGYLTVYQDLKAIDNTAEGAGEAAAIFCEDFEKPANKYLRSEERSDKAQGDYWSVYSDGSPSTSIHGTPNIGQQIVLAARDLVDESTSYSYSGTGTDNEFSSSGLVYYLYDKVGVDIGEYKSAQSYYDDLSSREGVRSIDIDSVSAGDILFFSHSREVYPGGRVQIDYMGVATGDGGMIYIDSRTGEVVEVDDIGSPAYILRVLSDSETSRGSILDYSESSDYSTLIRYDEYAEDIATNLSRVRDEGFDYGYLIDLTHEGEFKFYIPEFNESAGASWESINIIGRSVTIKAYSYTESRSISVSLDLYAGVGLYDKPESEDIVGEMHKDANFLKSLEYPDYSNPIIRPPSTVQLILGSAINLVGIVSDVTVEHMKPLDDQNRSIYLKVSFKVTQIAVDPPSWDDIRSGNASRISTSKRDYTTTDTNAPTFSDPDTESLYKLWASSR